MGKPDPIVYLAAMEMIGLAPDQVLAVGDSLEHDISGNATSSCTSIGENTSDRDQYRPAVCKKSEAC